MLEMQSQSIPQAFTFYRLQLQYALQWLRMYWIDLLLFLLFLYLVSGRDLMIGVTLGQQPGLVVAELPDAGPALPAGEPSAEPVAGVMNVSMLQPAEKPAASPAARPVADQGAAEGPSFYDPSDRARREDPAPHISNLTLVLSPDYGERKGLPAHIIRAKKERVKDYIRRYASIAQQEMETYGIPASITLAQGLLESNAGDSKLAVESNNHFGIKCRRKCRGCTCRNYSDDSDYDMFRVFQSVSESFREHSLLLQGSRYSKLKSYGTDYRKWAHGLKKAGYATDPRYGHKLVRIIEVLNLDRYDHVGV